MTINYDTIKDLYNNYKHLSDMNSQGKIIRTKKNCSGQIESTNEYRRFIQLENIFKDTKDPSDFSNVDQNKIKIFIDTFQILSHDYDKSHKSPINIMPDTFVPKKDTKNLFDNIIKKIT